MAGDLPRTVATTMFRIHDTSRSARLATLALVFNTLALTAADPAPSLATKPAPHLLIPGFVIRELPLQLTSLNNIEYAPDGRLFAAGYDGRMHLLKDTDGDGLEDRVITFQPEASPNYPLGMVIKDGAPHVVFTDEIARFVDTNGDGVPDKRETVIKGFDDPELVAAPYLNHRRVDSSMALASGDDGSWFVTMGNSGYDNPYWHDKAGIPHYTTDKRRGCLLQITPDGKVRQIASGLRYIMSLQRNRLGDLFGTDQEGATWCPNGNPFDELLHLQPGRHYGFPPRHPTFLPSVIDEPSVWDYSPQHQSTCGFRFNRADLGGKPFGPARWVDNAFVTGASRGILYRTAVAKTAAGYTARNEIFARFAELAVDCSFSPDGSLVVCTHTGKPDWGNGPRGEGRVFKIQRAPGNEPIPVLAWAASETETVIQFDQALESNWTAPETRISVVHGPQVTAGEQYEGTRPGYKVVQLQLRQPRAELTPQATRLSADRRSLVIKSPARRQASTYAVSIERTKAPSLDMALELTGLSARWEGANGDSWTGWLPHADFMAAREFTLGSAVHDAFWKGTTNKGTLKLSTQLDLWSMLQPLTQPTSKLDYTPAPEVVTVVFRSESKLNMEAPGTSVETLNEHESRVTLNGPVEGHWQPIHLTLDTPAKRLDVSYFTSIDKRRRQLGTRRFLLPFAEPAPKEIAPRQIPQIAGGNWAKGRELFNGKATCATCHRLRNEGNTVGPDLNTLVHRDYETVLRDITDPNAVINPDAVGYTLTLKNGDAITGTRVGENLDSITVAQANGKNLTVKKTEVAKAEPLSQSLMPVGLDKALTTEELRDLMTYLLTEQ